MIGLKNPFRGLNFLKLKFYIPATKKRRKRKVIKKRKMKRLKRHVRKRVLRRKSAKTRFDFPKKRSNMDYHLTVYVPGTTNKNKILPREVFRARVAEVRRELTRKFGGTTKVSATGSFRLRSRKVVTEPVAKVEIYTTRSRYLRYDQAIKKFLEKKRRQWGQESIGVTFESPGRQDEALYFVE